MYCEEWDSSSSSCSCEEDGSDWLDNTADSHDES